MKSYIFYEVFALCVCVLFSQPASKIKFEKEAAFRPVPRFDKFGLPALVTTCKQVYSRDVVCLHKL